MVKNNYNIQNMIKKTKDYLKEIRDKTGFSDYKIAKEFNINQSNLSKYSSGKAAFSEIHAWLFADVLEINPAEVVANTKLEQAQLKGSKDKAEFWLNQLKKISETSKPLKIEIAQINPVVGDLNNNAKKIIDFSLESYKNKANLVIFPELALVGYPPEDLLLRDDFIIQTKDKIEYIKSQIPSSISIVFGAPTKVDGNLYNSACLIQKSRIRFYHKQVLPNYGVFDEKRYFVAGNKSFIFECQQKKIGLLICEDAWEKKPVEELVNLGAQTLISINASPFQIGKHDNRINIIKKRVIDNNVDFIYVNMIGGQDDLVFDGGSFVIDSQAKITNQFPFFKEVSHSIYKPIYQNNNQNIEKDIYDALVLSTKDYVMKNNIFDGAIIGLSGGIDSALTLAITADALGNDNVQAVMMPHIYTSSISIIDAKEQTKNMNIKYHQINISDIVKSFNQELKELFKGTKEDITEENLQARIRGNILMSLANKFNKIVITTSNKSEMAVGYATLYGDMSGGFAPLKDVNKTLVYKLANYRNSISYVIPNRVIEREPSAELAKDQLDKDSLPNYEQLDSILELLIEKKLAVKQIIDKGFDADIVKKISRMVFSNEHKRYQSTVGPKITKNSFGKERRYPITSKFYP